MAPSFVFRRIEGSVGRPCFPQHGFDLSQAFSLCEHEWSRSVISGNVWVGSVVEQQPNNLYARSHVLRVGLAACGETNPPVR